jgi:hypothetical protein
MNNKLSLLLIVLCAAILLISQPALAAWTQAKGHAYNQLTFSYYTSKHKYSSIEVGSEGEVIKIEQPKYEDYKLTFYTEYGITNSLTAIFSAPYVWVESEEVQDTIGEDGPEGVGDIDVGFRYKISDNIFSGILMSVQCNLKIPEAYDFDDPVIHQNLGDGQYDGTIALVFGKGFSKGYAVVNAGYKYRFENTQLHDFKPSDQFKLRIDTGYAILPKLSLRGNLEWSKSIGNASISQDTKIAYVKAFGGSFAAEAKIINDTLSLEQDTINVGVALAYSVTSNIQAVISYNTVIRGIGHDADNIFISKDTGIGDTYAVALAYTF